MRTLVLILLAFFIALVAWLGASQPGDMTFVWMDYEIRMSAFLFLVLLALGGVLMFYWGQAWLFLTSAPTRLGRWRGDKRKDDGFQALYQSLDALSAQEQTEAQRLASRAAALLPEDKLAIYAEALAAEAAGDSTVAQVKYEELAQEKGMVFTALKGLVNQAEQQENWAAAVDLANRALMERPHNGWALLAVLKGYTKTGRYTDALEILPKLRKSATVEAEEAALWEGALHLRLAEQCLEAGESARAMAECATGMKAAPKLWALTSLYIDLLVKRGQYDEATDTAGRFFKDTPQRAAFERWMELTARSHTNGIFKKAEDLCKGLQEKPCGLIALTLAALRSQEWVPARRHITEALRLEPTQEAYKLLAAVEESATAGGTGRPVVEALQRALDAPQAFSSTWETQQDAALKIWHAVYAVPVATEESYL